MMSGLRKNKGQSTVEYVIVFTAIAAAVIFAALQVIKPAVNQTYSQSGNTIIKGGAYFANNVGFGFHGQ